jgi:NADPH:quinone reductase-like Zn-dependent oxidoreductase
MLEFQIRRDDYGANRIVEAPTPEPGDGEILARVERFSFTANNITYAVAGDKIGYWRFFPPHLADETAWGVIPVWGFATIERSNVAGLRAGERIFGYFPPATHLLMRPEDIAPARFFDRASHRKGLPDGYNLYRRVEAEAGYDAAHDDLRALLWPLHITSWCIADALSLADCHGATQIIILSASSKTSIGLAYAAKAASLAPRLVAVTSARNEDFVRSLGAYDEIVRYGDVAARIDPAAPTVIVDMSGDGETLGRLHQVLGPAMKKTINVGLTHWDKGFKNPSIITERSEFFFAPAHIAKRIAEWGPREFDARVSGFLRDAAARSAAWMRIDRRAGLAGLADIYGDVLSGGADPQSGIIVTLQA